MHTASRTLLLLQACPQPAMQMSRLCDKRSLQSPVTQSKHVHGRLMPRLHLVQWSEDVIKADPFFGRSWARFRVPPWVSKTIICDHLD